MNTVMEDVKDDVKNTIAPLVSGILGDTQKLVSQEAQLAKAELKRELTKAKDSALSFGVGAGAAILAAMMACHAGAYFLVWAFPDLPLWGACGIITLVLGGIAAFLLARAKQKATDIDMVPRQTVQSIKEGAEWLSKQV